jgi:hypothetical protein
MAGEFKYCNSCNFIVAFMNLYRIFLSFSIECSG